MSLVSLVKAESAFQALKIVIADCEKTTLVILNLVPSLICKFALRFFVDPDLLTDVFKVVKNVL